MEWKYKKKHIEYIKHLLCILEFLKAFSLSMIYEVLFEGELHDDF